MSQRIRRNTHLGKYPTPMGFPLGAVLLIVVGLFLALLLWGAFSLWIFFIPWIGFVLFCFRANKKYAKGLFYKIVARKKYNRVRNDIFINNLRTTLVLNQRSKQ